METKDLDIKCKDGFTLSAKLYIPKSSPKAAIMVAPATGILKTFYNSYASYLCENGYGVITFENRGIGKSKGRTINDGNPSLIAWGELDMPAVLEELKRQFPNVVYHISGHSAGGQLLGLMDNYQEVKSLFNFAASSGSMRNMPYPFKIRARFFMNVFLPMSNLFFGQGNSQWMGMGEPLPKHVARQWTKWCSGSAYVATDFGDEIKQHNYNELTLPSLWVHATDDGIANLINVKEMAGVYTNSDVKIVSLDPKGYDNRVIGHMNFFRSKYKDLWPMALDWFDKQS